MKCPNCQYENDSGNYCIKCGTPLMENTDSKDQREFPGGEQENGQQTVQDHDKLETVKTLSKGYFQYFLTVLKNPYQEASKVGKEQQMNSFITIGLYSIFIPMIIYFSLFDVLQWIEKPFFNLFLKPFIGSVLFVLLIGLYIFLVIKISKIPATIQDVISRFGTMLVPFVAIFALAFITAFLNMRIFFMFLFLGFTSAIFIAPPFVLMSYTKGRKAGIDLLYGTLIVYVLTFFTINLFSDMLFSMIGHVFEGFFQNVIPFY
ncbi:zinc ribbon domain-containing protein [Fervidibacillus halotolerans]|uniref:Zinc ribbon domain-containing protein n=1 Tax=Fervidibacillus halotolerans TaxID=2980027 RepID=A0A9E8RWS4_9BACI|nr:zinc ribbon domain-containing protein [Fervidibacillus halotolerans]WAA12060.1 zinc ribbon domain-containing protein [Fervidibacillus halotolerans]